MPDSTNARRLALVLWAVLAFVVWNVVFDRLVYIAAVEFTQEQIERHQRGEPVRSIESAFSPRVTAAAHRATLCAGAVVVAGAGLMLLARGRAGMP